MTAYHMLNNERKKFDGVFEKSARCLEFINIELSAHSRMWKTLFELKVERN